MEPKICIGNLAAYNNGILIFDWVDANQEPEELNAKAQEIANKYFEGEEYIIFDYQDFGGVTISEWENLEKVSMIANALVENGEALSFYIEHYVDQRKDFDIDQILRDFADSFVGEYENLNTFYDSCIEENLPSEIEQLKVFGNPLLNYLYFEQMKEYLELCGEYNFYESNGFHFVFKNFS
jgi:antirestriction protein